MAPSISVSQMPVTVTAPGVPVSVMVLPETVPVAVTPRVVLAALSVYYPTMVATVLGLSQVDSRLSDLVRVYGGGPWAILWRVRLRSGLPTLLAGLRVAAIAVILVVISVDLPAPVVPLRGQRGGRVGEKGECERGAPQGPLLLLRFVGLFCRVFPLLELLPL